MSKLTIASYCFILLILSAFTATGGPGNIARSAKVSASATLNEQCKPENVIDGNIRQLNKGEWVSDSHVTFWGEINYPWIKLEWDTPQNINRILLYDRPDKSSHTAGGTLFFSDGSEISITAIPDNGSPADVAFPPKQITWVRFQARDGKGEHLGLSEIEVYPAPRDYPDFVSWVDPYIETTRGRYFYFITGNRPFGMIGAAPLTRNQNQYGGGYNYNTTEVLGFPQIHCWMMSGLSIMPTTGDIDPTLREQNWKSDFRHEGEITQPGYHRLFLEKYKLWVEQTSTARSSFYRLTYTEDAYSKILLNLGGFLGTTTMVNAHVNKVNDREIEGYFDTQGRLWGGPGSIRIYFTMQFDTPFERMDGWVDKENQHDIDHITGATKLIPFNEGWSYQDAPSSGVSANYNMKNGDQLLVKAAISYTSIANAKENLERECNHWDFEKVREESRQEWNEWLGRIEVKGGSEQQRIKFYTDLWHVLLGRHILDDISGDYPDYTGKDGFQIRILPKNEQGQNKFHMFNSDALWLTQWNLNTLWGMAYPEVLDNFAASMIQYDANGGLLPRGPCGGGYSFIMSGCPATSLITSAWQRGINKLWDTQTGYEAMKRNHAPGGMLAHNRDKDLEFYIQNGYVPEAAGLTVQWAFEDWTIAQMAEKMGKKEDAAIFTKRSSGWKPLFHPDIKLLLPKKSNGEWLHTDPLAGWGYEEANSWQTTFGLANDIPGLAQVMGGNDQLCEKLNHAFEMAIPTDFVSSYNNGYVSYANQPGLSNAHVFSHAGKPWLTQYWVRRVAKQAYGGITPDKGYGGHDEDQGQMGGVSALMAIGLFSINGGSSITPTYEITSPVFDEIKIKLDPGYYEGEYFTIKTYGNSEKNCYIRKAKLNGKKHDNFQFSHEDFAKGGTLELWLGEKPNHKWGTH